MKIETRKKFTLIFVGIIAGLINGFLGAGGGLVIVPMLSSVLNYDSKLVHATTLACVLCMSLSAATIYFIKKTYDFGYVLPCIVGGIIGGIAGTFILKKLKNNIIDLVFSFVLILAGVSMIVF